MAQLLSDVSEKKEKISPAKYEAMRKKDNEMVKGIFKFYEVPGGFCEFNFRKYKGDPIIKYSMHDGKVYTVPRMVAKHLNSGTSYPEYEHIKGEPGTMNTYAIKTKIARTGFQSLEFMDEEMQNEDDKKIVEVSRV